ncbi:hypothetical protein O6H91_08G034600 [Diphasiastrum complanatum]|uniref:Uncharacterized protein n=2 Tax=Diphasiastrum complanatum TaxID=34168 RepID=A0ACC2CXA3_DIPCM|nr:hypothetical protein O6H91_08G034600 [Diphasiastrum complanatum]
MALAARTPSSVTCVVTSPSLMRYSAVASSRAWFLKSGTLQAVRPFSTWCGFHRDSLSFSTTKESKKSGIHSLKFGKAIRATAIRATAVAAPATFKTLTPLGDRVLIKIQTAEEKTQGGILLPTTAQTKPQSGEVVAVGEGKKFGDKQLQPSVMIGDTVVYLKYAGTEVLFDGVDHLLLKEDDIVGLLSGEDIKDLKPINERVLIKVAEAEEKTTGGILLTDTAKEKPVIGTIVAAGSGVYGEDGERKPLSVEVGNTVLYSKYAGNDFKGKDGSDYVVLRTPDVLAILS